MKNQTTYRICAHDENSVNFAIEGLSLSEALLVRPYRKLKEMTRRGYYYFTIQNEDPSVHSYENGIQFYQNDYFFDRHQNGWKKA